MTTPLFDRLEYNARSFPDVLCARYSHCAEHIGGGYGDGSVFRLRCGKPLDKVCLNQLI